MIPEARFLSRASRLAPRADCSRPSDHKRFPLFKDSSHCPVFDPPRGREWRGLCQPTAGSDNRSSQRGRTEEELSGLFGWPCRPTGVRCLPILSCKTQSSGPGKRSAPRRKHSRSRQGLAIPTLAQLARLLVCTPSFAASLKSSLSQERAGRQHNANNGWRPRGTSLPSFTQTCKIAHPSATRGRQLHNRAASRRTLPHGSNAVSHRLAREEGRATPELAAWLCISCLATMADYLPRSREEDGQLFPAAPAARLAVHNQLG